MTSTVAFIGKSGSGKTTLARAFLKLLRRNFPQNSVLMIDNDLSLELSESFGIKSRNTIYGVKSGKHEYKTGIPDGMSKQEFIEWALEDIIIQADEMTDVVASWFVTPKDCKCPSTKQIRDTLLKVISRYDFVIFDCEYDLKYLNLLVDCPIDETIIVSNSAKQDIALASKIAESSRKYAHDGQMDIILNKTSREKLNSVSEMLKSLEVNFLGAINHQDEIDYDKIASELEIFYSRMNLTQIES